LGKKNKTRKFQENLTFKNLIQHQFCGNTAEKFYLQGQWNKNYFLNQNPIWLELGCGKGEYTLYNSSKNPEINCIGIDVKGARIWKGAKTALKQDLTNAAFLRGQIQWLDRYFRQDEIDKIWIVFPDPHPKYRKAKNRLTNPIYLDIYARVLKPNNRIYLKTDSEFLFGYTLGILENYPSKIHQVVLDVHSSQQSPQDAKQVITFYEKGFIEKGKSIKFICFELLK